MPGNIFYLKEWTNEVYETTTPVYVNTDTEISDYVCARLGFNT